MFRFKTKIVRLIKNKFSYFGNKIGKYWETLEKKIIGIIGNIKLGVGFRRKPFN